ncbi:MAG TPA: hypothetical protein VFH52_10850 [Rhodanobacteraceae bacterium]|nr:hypothetical protein [Rhodanobacteraceae bacterium]
MRWILTAASALGLLIAIAARSPGLLGFGVLLALVCGLGAAFAFIEVQIQASSRAEYMSPGELDALKATVKASSPGTEPGRSLPPPTPQ